METTVCFPKTVPPATCVLWDNHFLDTSCTINKNDFYFTVHIGSNIDTFFFLETQPKCIENPESLDIKSIKMGLNTAHVKETKFIYI